MSEADSTLADQLAEEIREQVKAIVADEIKGRVRDAVIASIRDLPKPVVNYNAPAIEIPRQTSPAVNVDVSTDGLADAIARAIRSALAGLTIQAPQVTVNPKFDITIEKKPLDVSFERNRDGLIVSAKVVPAKP
jgi:hypothetical protein